MSFIRFIYKNIQQNIVKNNVTTAGKTYCGYRFSEFQILLSANIILNTLALKTDRTFKC